MKLLNLLVRRWLLLLFETNRSWRSTCGYSNFVWDSCQMGEEGRGGFFLRVFLYMSLKGFSPWATRLACGIGVLVSHILLLSMPIALDPQLWGVRFLITLARKHGRVEKKKGAQPTSGSCETGLSRWFMSCSQLEPGCPSRCNFWIGTIPSPINPHQHSSLALAAAQSPPLPTLLPTFKIP